MGNVTRIVNRKGYTYVWPVSEKKERETAAQNAADAHAKNRDGLDRIAEWERERRGDLEPYRMRVKLRADVRRKRRAKEFAFNVSKARYGAAW